MKNASAFEPERNPGIGEATNKSRDWISEKTINSIEDIGHVLLNAVIPNLLSGSEICRI